MGMEFCYFHERKSLVVSDYGFCCAGVPIEAQVRPNAIIFVVPCADHRRTVPGLPAQNSRSDRLRLPNAPTLASEKVNRYWFSLRTDAKANRRYSTLTPQQSQL